MISAYKKPLSGLLMLLSCTAAAATATECATVVFQDKLMLIDDNGVLVPKRPESGLPHYLSAGVHTLKVKQGPTLESTFRLNLKANHKYVLSVADNKAVMMSDAPLECDSGNIALTPAKQPIGRSQIQSNEQLPAKLEYRLRRLMHKIAVFHNKNGASGNQTNLVPKSRISQFGAVLDDSLSQESNSLKVLAVSPFSQAKKLGLASGDTIIALDSRAIELGGDTSATELLQNYLQPLKVGQTINMTVRRGGQVLTLNIPFKPVTVPEVYYNVGPSVDVIAEQ